MPPSEFEELPSILVYCRGKGWAVFPVKGKIPLTPNGFKDASRDPAQWLVWDRQFPGCGWAAPTGEVNGFDAIDADDPWAVEELEARLPNGPRVRTGGGGMHFYVAQVPGAKNWAKRIPGVDFRGDGGYVVLSGSPHET
jgi:putative DNA primase/helicase